MATFNQQNQHVIYQYNADNINFGLAQNKEDIVNELQKLKKEVDLAIKDHIFDEEASTDLKYSVEKAVQNAKKEQPEKQKVIEYLNKAKEVINSVASATGLVHAIATAIEKIKIFF